MPPTLGHYRQAVVAAGATLHVAGQVPVDASGSSVGVGDVDAQAACVAANLEAVLGAHGCRPRDVISVRVYATTREAGKAWAQARLELFADEPPASTLVYVSGLAHEDWQLEVDAVASIASGVN